MTRVRRTDPDRHDRILRAALDVVAEHGASGVTYRAVAERAGVPLGSMTYHFPSREELVYAAFSLLADTMHSRFDEILASLPPGTDPREGVVQIVTTQGEGYASEMVLSVELYALAVRDVRYRELVQAWMLRSRRSLERHFDADLAPMIDALQEGLVLHSHISTEPFDVARVRQAVYRLIADPA